MKYQTYFEGKIRKYFQNASTETFTEHANLSVQNLIKIFTIYMGTAAILVNGPRPFFFILIFFRKIGFDLHEKREIYLKKITLKCRLLKYLSILQIVSTD